MLKKALRVEYAHPGQEFVLAQLAALPDPLTVADIAEHARVAPKTVRNWLDEKWLVGFKLPGGRNHRKGTGEWRVHKTAYAIFIERRMNTYERAPGEQAQKGIQY